MFSRVFSRNSNWKYRYVPNIVMFKTHFNIEIKRGSNNIRCTVIIFYLGGNIHTYPLMKGGKLLNKNIYAV